jgi:hypothetical protein
MIFEHDPHVAMGRPVREGKGIELREISAAAEPAAQLSVDTPRVAR